MPTGGLGAGSNGEGRVDWNKLPIERIERVLVSIEDPNEEVLSALRSLVDAREIRRLGISREKPLEGVLEE